MPVARHLLRRNTIILRKMTMFYCVFLFFKMQNTTFTISTILNIQLVANRWGNSGNSVRLFFWAPKSLQMVIAAMKLKDAYSLEGKL